MIVIVYMVLSGFRTDVGILMLSVCNAFLGDDLIFWSNKMPEEWMRGILYQSAGTRVVFNVVLTTILS